MQRIYYREKKFICGNYTDIQIYPVYPKQKGRSPTKRKPSTETQTRLNAENAERKLLRLVHTNFQNKDYMVTFTYDNKHNPEDIDAAKKDIQNFFRRAKRLYAKSDIELKYIWVLEEGEKSGRIHFHTFMTGGVDRTELESLWGYGYANSRALQFTEEGVAGLVHYLTKNKVTYRRWSCSKNLKKPIERQNDYKVSRIRAKQIHEAAERDDVRDIKNIYPSWHTELNEYEIASIQSQKNEFSGEYYILLRLFDKNKV